LSGGIDHLTVFDPPAVAQDATIPFSGVYLRGLHFGPGDFAAMFQYAAMARFVERAIAKGEPKP
jgi:hypothetical protein